MIMLDERTELRELAEKLGMTYDNLVIFLINYYNANELKLAKAEAKKQKAAATRRKNKGQ